MVQQSFFNGTTICFTDVTVKNGTQKCFSAVFTKAFFLHRFCQILQNFSKFCQILSNFTKFCQILPNPPKCKGPSPMLFPFCKIFANLANLAPDLKLFAYLVDPKAKTYILNCKPPFEGGLGGRTLNPNKVKFGWAAWVKQRTQKRAFLTPTPPPDATGVGVRRAYTLYTP